MKLRHYRSLLLAGLFGLGVVTFGTVGSGCRPSSDQGSGEGGSSSGNGGHSNGGTTTSNGGTSGEGGTTTSNGGTTTNNGGTSGEGGTTTNNGGTTTNNGGTTTNNGGTTTNNGGTTTNNGGTTTNNGGTTTNNGGTTTSNGGTTTSNGGSSGSSTGPVTCTSDLMSLKSGTDSNWIASAPNTCGVQGAIYAFDDGSTCTSPSPITATACSGSNGCCIAGTTVIDSTFAKWGCGLGLDLNSTGGTSATKNAYTGTAKGFKITLTGTVATGQKIRIMYGPAASDPSGGTSPYIEVDGAGTYSVLFSDVKCPSWATTSQCTPISGSAAYTLKIQVSGGGATTDPAGPFNVCITSITPLT